MAGTTAYRNAMGGVAPLAMDIRELFLESALQDLSFRPAADLVAAGNGRAVLGQMCQQCHNPSLDQTQTRARFDVTKLDTTLREENNLAIKRLTLDVNAFRRMPPPRFRSLSPEEIELVTQELRK